MELIIGTTSRQHLNGIKNILLTIELFPAEYLDDMISDYLHNAETEHIWLTATIDDKPVGFCYCAPEQFTDGTYNLYAIGVQVDSHGNGIGSKIIRHLEEELRAKGKRILIIETSSSEAQVPARRLYQHLGYEEKGRLPEFWMEGDDKVIFWKQL